MTKPDIVDAANPRHKLAWERFAEFAGIEQITYVDHGNTESYHMIKDGRTFVLSAECNRVDGGFASIKEPANPLPKKVT